MSGRIRVEKEGRLGWIVFDHPERRNAISEEMWRAIPDAARVLDADPEVRVVGLRGEGEVAFISGADISEFAERRTGAAAADYDAQNARAYVSLMRIQKPVLASVHGFCVGGGCAIALSADLRYAADDAVFAIPAARLGLGYAAEGIEKLVQVVGLPAAKEIFFTGRSYDASEAHRIGLVNRVFPKAELDAGVRKIAEGIADNAPLTLRSAKQTFGSLAQEPSSRDREGIARAIRACYDSDDYQEGVRAFLEKRRPDFRGALSVAEAPLAGVRVLDLTRYLAGPFASMLLADYGADVVKVESPRGREFRPPGSARDSYFFLSSNRNKRSLALDIKVPAGREAFLRLLPGFDVVIENFRPGVMQKLGLGAAELLELHPRLVYCGISGFGASGPYQDRPGFDQIAQGMSGFMSLTGTAESGPTRAGIAIADLLGGLFAAQGVQLALFARERTGRGQIVETSLLEAMIGVLSWGAGMFFERGVAPGPAGQHHPLSAPYGRFRARDGYLNVAAGNEGMWRKLAEVLGHPEWTDDARFRGSADRLRNRDELTRAMDDALAGEPVEHWVERLNEAGVPAGPVLDLAQVFSDPQVRAREMLVELPHPELGVFRTTGLPVKLSETPGAIARRPPLHGEHGEEILREAGFTSEEISVLRDEKAMGGPP